MLFYVVKGICYFVGVLFELLLVYSLIAKPIVYDRKRQAAIGYGIPLIICFLLFIFVPNDENYNIPTTNNTSGGNVSVSGSVSASLPSSVTPSRYKEIPVASVQKVPIQEVKVMPIAPANITPINNIANTTTTNEKQYVDANGRGTIIGDTDSKIYHMPDGNKNYYNNEMKKTSNNVYFKTTQEAESAGYRASKR